MVDYSSYRYCNHFIFTFNNPFNDKLEQEIRTLKIRIRSLENQIQNPNSSSNTTSLEEISNQIQDLKDELKNSSPQ